MRTPVADFLQLTDKTILVLGVANRKSVAYLIGQELTAAGAKVVYVVRSPARQETVSKLVNPAPVFICDVEHQDQIDCLRDEVGSKFPVIHGIVHSLAFADYSEGWLPF